MAPSFRAAASLVRQLRLPCKVILDSNASMHNSANELNELYFFGLHSTAVSPREKFELFWWHHKGRPCMRSRRLLDATRSSRGSHSAICFNRERWKWHLARCAIRNASSIDQWTSPCRVAGNLALAYPSSS